MKVAFHLVNGLNSHPSVKVTLCKRIHSPIGTSMLSHGIYHDVSRQPYRNVDFNLDISLQSIHWRCLSYSVQAFWPQWPNGQGTGLLSQGLWVRVPSGVIAFFV